METLKLVGYIVAVICLLIMLYQMYDEFLLTKWRKNLKVGDKVLIKLSYYEGQVIKHTYVPAIITSTMNSYTGRYKVLYDPDSLNDVIEEYKFQDIYAPTEPYYAQICPTLPFD